MKFRYTTNITFLVMIKVDKNASKLCTAQKMKFSIKDFLSKCDQIRRKLRIWSHLLKKSLIENFIFCAVLTLSLSPLILFQSMKSFRTMN